MGEKYSDISIVRASHGPAPWEELLEAVVAELGWAEEEEVFSYLESLSRCSLIRATLGEVRPPVDAWEGRLFNRAGEARWGRQGDGYRAWTIREARDGEPGEAVCALLRWYYLLGEYDGPGEAGTGIFTEPRYPGKKLVYPLPGEGSSGTHDRAYIEVREYFRERPRWGELPHGDAVEDALNQPLLVDHRFEGVGLGQGRANNG